MHLYVAIFLVLNSWLLTKYLHTIKIYGKYLQIKTVIYDYSQLILSQTQNKGKKRESKCESCDITFTDRNEFAQHFEDVHEGKKPFKCTLCDKTFLEKLGMKKHVETVHEGIKLYQCHVCDKSFGWHGMLKRHISAVHNKAKPFQCSQCETRFTENT